MKKLIIVLVVLFLPLSMLLAVPLSTETFTPTTTDTFTITPTDTVTPTSTMTHTVSPTITATPTISPTFTCSPTPQPKLFAYPNPAAFTDKIAVAYPLDNGKLASKVTIVIFNMGGNEVATIVDDIPANENAGYTSFDIKKLARGTYIYRITIRYADGSEDRLPIKKFAVLK